ncbi:MAG: hypothetical protein AB7G93_17365 [Bdellovibrionales bacterium]
MHPKTQISPSRVAVEKMLRAGWVGQVKIDGHRAQIHIPADPGEPPIAFNRQGKPHQKLLPDKVTAELRRLFKIECDWTVIDAEWLKSEDKLFVFDVLKLDGKILRSLTYMERWKLLPRLYISRHVQTLPLLTTTEKCMAILAQQDPTVEGLVFKAAASKGFGDTCIVRCRKRL